VSNIKQLPNGIWVVSNDTHISKWVEEHNSLKCDPHLFHWLEPRIQGCKRAWDVGANIGDHTRFYLDIGLSVCAFEPNPDAYECLKRNCGEAICKNLAASDMRGIIKMTLSDNVGASYVDENGQVEVDTIPLDELEEAIWPPDFIKIDVEGFESKALAGMEKLVRSKKPKLFVEFNQGALERSGSSPKQLKEQIESYGYTQFQIYPPIAKPEDLQYDYLCS
jgi:FkbM family methyltransferase